MNPLAGRAGYSTYTLKAVFADTPEIYLGQLDKGIIHIPTGSTITTLTYYSRNYSDSIYAPLHTSAGVAVTQTVVANKAYRLPAEVDACVDIKIVSNVDGAITISGKNVY